MKKNILFLYGGASYEHEVSCLSIKNIIKEVNKEKYNYQIVYITKANDWFLVDDNYQEQEMIDNIIDFIKKFDCIFNIIHGSNGEDGRLQSLLEMYNIKYVGCNSVSSMLCMNKDLTKMLLDYNDIPVVPVFSVDNIIYPVMVKSAASGSSFGIGKANNDEELEIAIEEAKKYSKDYLIEQYIKARELECAVIEKDDEIYASTLGEIKSCNEFYDYDAKYNLPSQTVIPADLSEEISNKIRHYAKEAFKVLKCQGMARVDFFYDEENQKIYLNELNTLPGFTDISMYPKLLNYDGITTAELIDILITNALNK